MKKFLKSFFNAWVGIWFCVTKEVNFKVHLVAAIIAIGLAIALNCSGIEWMIISLCIALVTSLEMVNTAIEHVCNMHTTTFSPQIKIIKDVAAGAVLLSSMVAAVCGAVIFVPKIILFFHAN